MSCTEEWDGVAPMTLTSTGPMCSPGVLLPPLLGVDDPSGVGTDSADGRRPGSTSCSPVSSWDTSSSRLAANTSLLSDAPLLDEEREEEWCDIPIESCDTRWMARI